MKKCDDKITTGEIVFDGCESNNCNLEKGMGLNEVLDKLCDLLKFTGSGLELMIIVDRPSITPNQVAVITGFNAEEFDWYVDDVLQTNNTTRTLVVSDKCKVYAVSGNKKSNTLFIDTKEEPYSCNLLVNILNVEA